MDIPSVSVDDSGAETLTNVLPNEILLCIFRFLRYDDLIRVEKVCCRWKTVVETCFATEKLLKISYPSDDNWMRLHVRFSAGLSRDSKNSPGSSALERLRRYGHSIQTLVLHWNISNDDINWVGEIADRFPNLLKMELRGVRIANDGFKYLSTKCCQLKNVSLSSCKFTNEGLELFLQALPAINSLGISIIDDIFGARCGREYLSMLKHSNRPADVSAVFSSCRNLHTLVLGGRIRCSDTVHFFTFFKECLLRKLAIEHSDMPNEMLVQIQHCSLLEELRLLDCPNVDDSTLIEISQGCSNLRTVSLMVLPLVSDDGLKCFAACKHLSAFKTDIDKVTDETFVELSKCVNLREVTLWSGAMVSDRGCAALLAHCPLLELLNIRDCKGVSNATVVSAIEAVECRHNGLVLELQIRDTSVTPQKYEKCHPLLRLNTGYQCLPFSSTSHF